MKKRIGFTVILCLIAVCIAVLFYIYKTSDGSDKEWNVLSTEETEDGLRVQIAGENHMKKEGVLLEADSFESENNLVSFLNDGILDDYNARWSSENNWDNTEHWVMITFPEEVSIGCVRLYWERFNVCEYSIEISEDGQVWSSVADFHDSPIEKCQDILFKQAPETKHLRLHILDVTKFEDDGSLYHQNVSLLEIEVYDSLEETLVIPSPEISDGTGRKIEIPKLSNGYTLQLLGCDYENLIDADGKIADTLSETQVEIGYQLCRGDKSFELPALKVTIPASEASGTVSLLPNHYEPMEWQPTEGSYSISNAKNIYITDESLRPTAEIFADDLFSQYEITLDIVTTTETELANLANEGDFYLKYSADTLPTEGYELSLGTSIQNVSIIEGGSLAGIRWGCVSFLDLIESGTDIPKGMICDYPRYEVRGFGIDVGRRPISLDMLYRIVEAMSKEKMNTLLVHLNDNEIISQSDHDGTVESVLHLYSGFRLESDISNSEGIGLTSTDLYYTKEEFRDFIRTAAYYGVEVVPEIDTPAHSLAFIKVFPEIGKTDDVFTADQLDLSKEETSKLITSVWDEYLLGDTPVFKECNIIHIGMDEYYGDKNAFSFYLQELTKHLKDTTPEKTLRMWGSLTGMDIDYSMLSRDIQIQLWNTEWADPTEMYQAGFGIINSQNTHLYIIPGGGYDWLDVDYLEHEWEPNIFSGDEKTWEIPSYSPQMLGASYMLWNDMIKIDGIDLSEDDIYSRFEEPLSVIGQKLWN